MSKDYSPIRFYERGQPYFEFTNFAEYPIQLDGKTWPTSEHYFQAQKFVGTPYLEQVRNLPRARDAFDLSRRPEVSPWLRGDWEKVKLDVMYKALLAKFSQHSNLRDMLAKTGNRQLIEHTSRDSYWGDGGDGRGQNHLGQLLMKVRAELLTLSNAGKKNEISWDTRTCRPTKTQKPSANIHDTSLPGNHTPPKTPYSVPREHIKQRAAIGQFNQKAAIGQFNQKAAVGHVNSRAPVEHISQRGGSINQNGAIGCSSAISQIPATHSLGGLSNGNGDGGVAKGRLNYGDHSMRVAIAFLCCLVLLLIFLFLSS